MNNEQQFGTCLACGRYTILLNRNCIACWERTAMTHVKLMAQMQPKPVDPFEEWWQSRHGRSAMDGVEYCDGLGTGCVTYKDEARTIWQAALASKGAQP